ncbi:hypothetical protein QUB61_21920 [Microcoleus sp. C2D2]
MPATVMSSEQARCLCHNRQIFLWSRHPGCYSYVFRTGKMPVPQQTNIFVKQHLACYSYIFRTGKMPVPQQTNIFVQASCLL